MTPRILLVSNLDAPFVSQDREILKEMGSVHHMIYQGRTQLPELIWAITRSDVIVCWFVLGYATTSVLMGKILGKPVVLVPAGWDARLVPEIGYGAMVTPSRIRMTRFALRHADLLLAISADMAAATQEWTTRKPEVLYLGVDTQRFRPQGPRDGSVLTVATVSNEVDSKRKGLPDFVKVATEFPDREFVLVGRLAEHVAASLRRRAPSNVNFVGRLDDDQLLERYRRASVYVQVSAHEGFGLALAEAMACGCTPVVSNRGALPEVVGPAGYYVEYGNLESVREAIREALVRPKGAAASNRIVEKFELGRRREGLRRQIRELFESSREA